MGTLRTIASIVVVPLLLGITAVAVYLSIHNSWNLDIVIVCTLVFVLLYLHLFEKLTPLKLQWMGNREEAKPDTFHFLLLTLVSILGDFAALSLTLHLHSLLEIEWEFWNNLSFVPAYIVANLLGEFIPYWYHRISHIGNEESWLSYFLWRIHSVHHIPTKMNWRKTAWMHPLNSFVNAFTKIFPLLFIGFSYDILFAVGMTSIVVSYLSHANIYARTWLLDYIIITPRVHHFHHSTKQEEAKNYANVIPFWDLLLGTYFNNGQEVDQVGVIEGNKDAYPSTRDFGEQMRFPFHT